MSFLRIKGIICDEFANIDNKTYKTEFCFSRQTANTMRKTKTLIGSWNNFVSLFNFVKKQKKGIMIKRIDLVNRTISIKFENVGRYHDDT